MINLTSKKDSVWKFAWEDAWYYVRISVCWSVWGSIYNSVYISAWNRVDFAVGSSVRNSLK
jgi:hypothetical protein